MLELPDDVNRELYRDAPWYREDVDRELAERKAAHEFLQELAGANYRDRRASARPWEFCTHGDRSGSAFRVSYGYTANVSHSPMSGWEWWIEGEDGGMIDDDDTEGVAVSGAARSGRAARGAVTAACRRLNPHWDGVWGEGAPIFP